jgi:hypothetical protein
MKEFNIDLVIDKTFNVRAETLQEAKELAIQKAHQLMGSYNSLTIDFVEEVENDGEEKSIMAKWTIVAYPDEETSGSKKSKVIEAKDWDEAIDIAWKEFPEYHEVGAYKNE